MARNITPWRSTTFGVIFTVLAMYIGLPIFLRMPNWIDTTLYDLAVRNLFRGGVLDREVFDTNLPGYIWALSLVRAVGGWSTEAVHVADFIIITTIVTLLFRFLKTANVALSARVWAVAGVALFYPYIPEMNHAQRDVWMLLPAVGATILRFSRIQFTTTSVFWPGVAEGVLWAVAFWFKPHVIVPAAMVWLASTRAVGGGLKDLLGQFVGGTIIGTCGVTWLVATGAWPHFVEVFTVWNQGYAATLRAEFPNQVHWQFRYFPIWSLLQPIAMVLACRNVLAWWKGNPREPIAASRGMLSTLYLAWLAQAFLFQRSFSYIHTPEVLLSIFVFAANARAIVFFVLVWIAIAGAVHRYSDSHPDLKESLSTMKDSGHWLPLFLPRHPLTDPEQLALWPRVWQTEDPDTRRNDFSRMQDYHGKPDWKQIREVTVFLHANQIGDHQLICWHDSCHVLYLEADLQPGCRFMHASTVSCLGKEACERIQDELRITIARGARVYAVGDLNCALLASLNEPSPGPGKELPGLSANVRKRFPFEQTPVFRSANGTGRYVVYEVTQPLGLLPITGE